MVEKDQSRFVADFLSRNSERIPKLNGHTRLLHLRSHYGTMWGDSHFCSSETKRRPYSSIPWNHPIYQLNCESKWVYDDTRFWLGVKKIIHQWRNKEIWSLILREAEHPQISLAFTDKLVETSEKNWHTIYATISVKVY